MIRSAPSLGIAVLAMVGCTPSAKTTPATAGDPPVIRQYLSGDHNDWEPSLAVGPAGSVTVIAGRWPASVPEMQSPAMVTWSSTDGGRNFDLTSLFPTGGGDERIKADGRGRLYASWIRVERDSTGKGFDLTKGGLVLATSDDRGASWRTTIAASMPSGVGDKPELAVSKDGHDVYLAFMGPGTLDVVASHDGGGTWERHVLDSTRTGHWPTSMALASNGTLLVTNARREGSSRDTLLTVAVQLFRSTDGGRTWQGRVISRSKRRARPGDCVHGSSCPVQIPYAAAGIDDHDHAYLAYTEGELRQAFALELITSADGGRTWSEPTRLSSASRPATSDLADTFYPMLAAAGDGLVYVAWFDDREGPLQLWAKRTVDGGRSWSGDVRLSAPAGLAGIYGEYGGLGIDAHGALHVAWPEGTGHVSRGGKGGTWYARWDGRPVP